MSRGADFIASLKPASFRGVPFGVRGSRKIFGRRTTTHEYPFRDVVWVEDLGRKGRVITLTGYLLADPILYAAGDVLSQQQALIAAAETYGSGKLVHPTLGALTVSVTGDLAINESIEAGGVLEFELTVTEAGQKLFPSVAVATTDAVVAAATAALPPLSTDFTLAMAAPLSVGAITPQTALAAVGPWATQITAFAKDATNLFSLGAGLAGDFGRFFNGGNLGALASGLGLLGLNSAATTIGALADAASAARQSVQTAVGFVETVAGALGLGASSHSAADLAAAVQAAIAAATATCADPADAIRLLTQLAAGVPAVGANATDVGAAIGDLFRRTAAVALAQAGSTYQPSSYQDANAVRAAITAVLDAEILTAGNAGDDASFNALRALRVAVVQDLTARGATLAPIVTVTPGAALPAIVLAQQLYRDPTRADQLTLFSGAANPLFLPASFQALAT